MNYSQLNNDARLLGADLAVNESLKAVCPSCNGGSSKERSFSVTRTVEGVLYNCYRAKCPVSGFVATAAGLLQPSRKQQKLREYYHPVLPLEACDEDFFYQRFEITKTESVFRSERGEYIFAILDSRGYTRGYTVRQPTWAGEPQAPRTGDERTTTPKARCFPHTPQPMQSFYVPNPLDACRPQTLVAVEDQVSAIKVAEAGFKTVALCGTGVNLDKVREWSALSPQEVLIALDEDATQEAFKIARRWGLAFPTVRVVLLQQDLKDSLLEEIPEILGVTE